MKPLPERVPQDAASPVIGEVPVELLTRIREEVAAQTGGDAAELTLLRAESVTWNDGSLGCPMPDEIYTQALVPGYWVVFAWRGREFDYRCDDRGHCRLCDPSLPKERASP